MEIKVQEVNFVSKQVSSHLNFIYPLKLANKPKVSKLPSKTRMYPILFILFLKLHFGLSLGFLPIWIPQDVYFQVQAFISNHAHKKIRD